jgi:hypothetical protein
MYKLLFFKQNKFVKNVEKRKYSKFNIGWEYEIKYEKWNTDFYTNRKSEEKKVKLKKIKLTKNYIQRNLETSISKKLRKGSFVDDSLVRRYIDFYYKNNLYINFNIFEFNIENTEDCILNAKSLFNNVYHKNIWKTKKVYSIVKAENIKIFLYFLIFFIDNCICKFTVKIIGEINDEDKNYLNSRFFDQIITVNGCEKIKNKKYDILKLTHLCVFSVKENNLKYDHLPKFLFQY